MATKSTKPRPAKAAKKAPKAQKPATAAKKPVAAKKAAVATRPSSRQIGIIETFDKIPDAVSTRVYESSYNFAAVEPGKSLVIPVSGNTPEEKISSAKKIRGNVFAALYRFKNNNPEAKEWKTAIRIVNDALGVPEKVGFYRQKDEPAAK